MSRSPWCLSSSIAAFPILLLLRWGCGPARQVPVEMLDGHPNPLPQFAHLQTGLGAARNPRAGIWRSSRAAPAPAGHGNQLSQDPSLVEGGVLPPVPVTGTPGHGCPYPMLCPKERVKEERKKRVPDAPTQRQGG